MLDQIAQQVREQVETRLAASDGFNATANTLYGSSYFSIDFTGGNYNYFRGQIDPILLEKSSAFKYPAVCLWAFREVNTHKQKFMRFSGPVIIGADFHIAHPSSKAPWDFEKLPDAVSTALFDIFDRESNQNWEQTTVYNGDVEVVRVPVRMGATNWLQTLRLTATFEVHEQ